MRSLEAAQVKMEEKLNYMTNFIDQELAKVRENPVSSITRIFSLFGDTLKCVIKKILYFSHVLISSNISLLSRL